MENSERAGRVQALMREQKLDVVVCALPANVVMLSGYWPVVGTGVAVAFAAGGVELLIPEDEARLAETGWARQVRTFQPGSLDHLQGPAAAIREPLSEMVGSSQARVGYESGAVSEPASYSAMHLYGGCMAPLLAECFPHANLVLADRMLAELRGRKTALEIDRIRVACRIAAGAFTNGANWIIAGITEIGAADAFRRRLSAGAVTEPDVRRADGFTWCMSGPNSAMAAGAYARSSTRKIDRGDLALVHCNSYADGYWTDITRTFCVGHADERQRDIYGAVFEARQAALDTIRPGIAASAVDQAAREVLREHGLGDAFPHSTGHGVGFEAISANALPRIHPASPDVLEPGMVFNVEPAVYFNGYGGVRHCDVVAVTDTGYEVLTPFQSRTAELCLGA